MSGVDPVGDNPDLCFEGDTRPGQGDGTGPAIRCSFAWNNLAPRLGVAFDLRGDGRAKLFASYGRFYAKIPNDLAARSMSADAGITRQDYRDAALTQPVANGTLFAGGLTHFQQAGLHAAPIDPDSGSTYKNEILAGVEFDVLNSTNLAFRFIRRNMPQILEDISDLPLVGYFEPFASGACGAASVEYAILNVNADVPTVSCGGVLPSSFEDPTHMYNAFELTLNRRLAGNWCGDRVVPVQPARRQLRGILPVGQRPVRSGDHLALRLPDQRPDLHSDRDFTAARGDIRYQGDSLGTGVLPNDRPHQLKLYGNYILDTSTSASASTPSRAPL